MKTLSRFTLVASLCLSGLGSNAQLLNNFYHISGFPADHSNGDKVITAKATEKMPVATYVVAGVSFASSISEMQSVALSKYALDGTPLFHNTFLLNSASKSTSVAVKGLVEATNARETGYGVLAFTTAQPQQSVLIRTDEDGKLLWKTEVGMEEAAALAYDNHLNRFLVLQRSMSGTSADLQLIAIDASTGVVLFTRNYDGFNKSDDQPAAIVYDAPEKSYLLVGTSLIKTIIGTEVQLMLTRTTTTGSLVYTRTIGYFGVEHTAIDATLLPNGFNTQIAIGGTISGVLNGNAYKRQPSYTIVDARTGSTADVNVIEKYFELTGITFLPAASSLAIVGNNPLSPLALGVEANLFAIDPTDPALIGLVHAYNVPSSTFTFNNINKGADDMSLVSVGTHRFPFPWAGSPANLTYNWLTTADAQGNGKCDIPDTLSVFDFPAPTLASAVTSVLFFKTPIRLEEIDQTENLLDGCDLPFRMAATVAPASSVDFRLYPNPANEAVTIEYSVAQNDNAILTIIDMTGRVISSQQLLSGDHMTTTVNTSDISSGAYYSDLRVNGQSVMKNKLVVQH